ncbi:protein-glutamine gamma-glutamyltransferase [Paenibacillus sp. NEAU-GSW1]|uniref:protein-glutamine gamma-glutamyltransferase n=1 Tax=Paenibacillus sp. NEAU-GSW1 TaxID=2682486 RepID=UPI0012E31CCE|nr:protein-glutamine gamma-glutamyltransferase [Paenibacillus sp. NEAU-GSW1]MUT64792.1 protein-glutamine gamma-glutamyltransferase [Paenibacillus sp. NEAU-GSW1]
MIVISGGNGAQWIEQMPLSQLEREIVRGKQLSRVVYRYDSPEDLRFELAMRQSIVNAAKALQESQAAFAIFEKSRCNEQYWSRTREGGFRLRSGVRPSDAIRDIFQNGELYGFECATAIVIVWYKAILDVIGDEAFNRYFTNLYLRDWNHDSDLWLISTHDKDEAFPGDVLYFKNPDHDLDTPEWQGENVVKLEGNLFFGHGIGIETGEEIIAALNRQREPGAMTSAYLSDLVVYPNFEYLRRLTMRLHAELGLTAPRLIGGQCIEAVIGSRTAVR